MLPTAACATEDSRALRLAAHLRHQSAVAVHSRQGGRRERSAQRTLRSRILCLRPVPNVAALLFERSDGATAALLSSGWRPVRTTDCFKPRGRRRDSTNESHSILVKVINAKKLGEFMCHFSILIGRVMVEWFLPLAFIRRRRPRVCPLCRRAGPHESPR
jgi:hypothetical protein